MSSIQNVLQEHSATDEYYLGTRGVASCVAVIVTFSNSTTIFIEHISGHHLFRDIPTIKGTQRRIERVVSHVFLRVGSAAIIRSVMLLGGLQQGSDRSESPYAALEEAIRQLCHNRATICAITDRTTSSQLRAFLNAIVLVRLQLNPEPVLHNGMEKFSYDLSIVVTIQNPGDSGYLMITQACSIYLGARQVYLMVVLNAETGEMVVSGQFAALHGTWSLHATQMSSRCYSIVCKMAPLMERVNLLERMVVEEKFDEEDAEDGIDDDESNDV